MPPSDEEKLNTAFGSTAPPASLSSNPPQDLSISNWERYELLEMLGRGGMGDVYKARDRRLGRIVAIKFLRGAAPDRAMRFLQEARAQARIDHPNVCKVFEVGDVGGKAFIAMQYVEGQRLDQAAPHMSLPEKVQALRDVSVAMHEAHKLGIIHRDLKPSNIMVERNEEGRWFPVVMDFGLAHEVSDERGLTQTGAVIGTPSYMSPEQARGDVRNIDRRSDVYSLGATLYEVLSGAPPFVDTTFIGTLHKVINEDAPSLRARAPQLPSDLETIVLKCLSKDSNQRYPSARALAEDLARYIDGEPIFGQRPSLVYRLRRSARKHRALVVVSAASLACILVVASLGVRSWLLARQTQRQATERARLAERLGQDVKEIEWLLRASSMLPLHDTSQEQQLVRELMARIESQSQGLDDQGNGLVYYALGRGHLALHEVEQAHEALVRARERGLDSPELHYARGRVLGELYHRALQEVLRSADKPQPQLAEQQKRLEKQYLEPALEALQRCQGLKLESPRYLEGLIAFYRREYDVAAQAAARAIQETPWIHEPRKLVGDVAYTRAIEHLARGEHDLARARFREAAARYEEATRSAPSDARLHEALADAWLQHADVDQRQGKAVKDAMELALSSYKSAIQAAPLQSEGYTKKAFALRRWYLAKFFDEDASPILAEWLSTASRAVELNPRDAYAYEALGYAYFMRAMRAERNLEDATRSWNEAIATLEKALEIKQDYAQGCHTLAVIHRRRAESLHEHGQDPAAELAAAARWIERSLQLDPEYPATNINAMDLYTLIATYRLERGADPEAELKKALRVGERFLAMNKKHYSALHHIAIAELVHARYLLESGGDPRPILDRAIQHLDSSLSVNPTYGRTYLHRAQAHHFAALYAMRENLDPGDALDRSRRDLESASRHTPGSVECLVRDSQVALTAAEWMQRQGKPSLPLLQKARTEGERAVKEYPYGEARQELARVYWQLAKVESSRQALAEIDQGLEQAALALQRNPNLADAHALRGALILLRAQKARPVAVECSEAVRQTQVELTRAVELNPLLRRKYAEPMREAEGMRCSRGGP